jgi:trigger factor
MTGRTSPSAEFEQLSPTAYRVNVSVPEEKIKSKLDTVYAELGKGASIPGFRPGKVPRNILNRHYGREKILAEATEEVMNDTFWPLIKERELTLIGNPRIDTKEWKEGEEFSYVAVMEVMPQVPEIDYSQLKATLPEREVTDEDIEDSLRRFRIQWGTSVDITDRPSKTGDFLTVDFEGEVPDEMVTTAEGELPWRIAERDMDLELGGGKALAGLEDALTGVELEEIKEFDLTLPDDFPDKRVRGKTLKAKSRVKSIKERTLAELTDELIKEKLGSQGIEALDSLKGRIAQEIQTANAQADEKAKSDQIEAYLARAMDFPLPEGLVRSEFNDILDRSLAALRDRGINIEELMKPDDERGIRMRKRARYQAERMARLNLLYREIARRESILVKDEEIANFIMMQAYRQGLKESDLKLLVKDRHFINATREDLLRIKVSHFLISKVNVERTPLDKYRAQMEKAVEEASEVENRFLESAEDPLTAHSHDYLPSTDDKNVGHDHGSEGSAADSES